MANGVWSVAAGYYAVGQEWARQTLVSGLDRETARFRVRAFPESAGGDVV